MQSDILTKQIVDALAAAYPDEPINNIEQYAEQLVNELIDAALIGYVIPDVQQLRRDVVIAYTRRS